jgi:hypothetical protein
VSLLYAISFIVIALVKREKSWFYIEKCVGADIIRPEFFVLPNRADNIRPYTIISIVNYYIVWYNIGNRIVW